jgi:hypothetical protein
MSPTEVWKQKKVGHVQQYIGQVIGHPPMPPPQENVWVRFDRYVVSEGMIVPAPAARLAEYDPWKEYQRARKSRRDQRVPYETLIRLANGLRPAPGTGTFTGGLKPADAEALLEWCGQHGLLGILAHRLRMAILAPRWEEIDIQKPDKVTLECVPSQQVFLRAGRVWQRGTRRKTGFSTRAEMFDRRGRLKRMRLALPGAHDGGLVPHAFVPPGWPKPFAVLEDLRQPTLDIVTLKVGLAPFFPGVAQKDAETHAYPLPPSPGFWRHYGEPVAEFFKGAIALADAVKLLDGSVHQVAEGLQILNTLVAPVGPRLGGSKRDFRMDWPSPSLLGTLAMMLLQDVAAGRRMRSCAACGQWFVRGSWDKQYCSKRCKYRVQKSRYRKLQKRYHARP